MGDSFSFEHLLNNQPLVPLIDAVHCMDGLSFWHGSKQEHKTFDYNTAEPGVRECLAWAGSESPQDARQTLSQDELAAIRAWTCTPLCTRVTHRRRRL